MQSDHPAIFVLYVAPLAVSAILIVGTNVYLYCTIFQSKRKLENNLKLSGEDDYKIKKLQRLIYNLQLQSESSVPLFILGGIDCLFNVLWIIIFILINAFYPLSSNPVLGIYFYQFISYPLEYCQIISYSITYGVYKKQIRMKLRKYCQRFQRLLPLRPSKVITLQSQ